MSLIIDHLYLSPVVVSRDTSFFKAKKITHVLVAAKSLKQHFPETVTYHQLQLSDNPTANISKYFAEGIRFLHEAISKEQNVLVHCMGGISRSTSMVIAYVMFTMNLSFEKAFAFVKKQHSKTNPNPGFVSQLKKLEDAIAEYNTLKTEKYEKEIDYKLLDALIFDHANKEKLTKKETKIKTKTK